MDQPNATFKLADHLRFEHKATGTVNYFNVPQEWADMINHRISELAGEAIMIGEANEPPTNAELVQMMIPIRDQLEQQYGPFTMEQLLFISNALTFCYSGVIGFNAGYSQGMNNAMINKVISSFSKLMGSRLETGSFSPPKAEA